VRLGRSWVSPSFSIGYFRQIAPMTRHYSNAPSTSSMWSWLGVSFLQQGASYVESSPHTTHSLLIATPHLHNSTCRSFQPCTHIPIRPPLVSGNVLWLLAFSRGQLRIQIGAYDAQQADELRLIVGKVRLRRSYDADRGRLRSDMIELPVALISCSSDRRSVQPPRHTGEAAT